MSGSIHPAAVLHGAELSDGCVVHEYASLGAAVALAPNSTVGPGARLLGRVRVGSAVVIGANAVLGVMEASSTSEIVIGSDVQIGANATIRSGVVVGRGAVIGEGAVVDADVPAYAVVRGIPARIVGYVGGLLEAAEVLTPAVDEPVPTTVPGVRFYPVARARDLRGSLAAVNFADLPFVPQRVFAVHAVPDESVRGAHAHHTCGQLLVCLSGEVSCVADDGLVRQAFRLSGPTAGLFIPPMIWGMQYRYTSDAVLLILAEFPYDPSDYIRDYEEFLELVARQ